MNITKILGLKVVAIKGWNYQSPPQPMYIFFDDDKTFIYLDEQDYNRYHKCDINARNIKICQDQEFYSELMANHSLLDVTP